MEYEYFYKRSYEIRNKYISNKLSLSSYDVLVSAYNKSERVNFILQEIDAIEKHIFILKEYKFSDKILETLDPSYTIFNFSELSDESEILNNYFKQNILPLKDKKILVDITGFLRPHIVYFLRLCKANNIKSIDFLYSEPNNYKKKEDTQFSMDFQTVRDIKGCSGSHIHDTSNDYLIVGAGYDYDLILKVAKEKKQTEKVQVLGFPSLQADMFQQNILKAYNADEEIQLELDSQSVILAPANDPFVTASLISDFVKKANMKKPITNLYLSPLSSKAQTLGMALYYVTERIATATSIIFPFCDGYEQETSEGISKFWIYSIEL
ncbi:hypothetical protein QWT87_19995 [Chryseobacterium sp. APV1]|uniref:Uncharacterized protein n=1 Tax=Chryseobacterium urinae TaxID=3058400 RepID=A0ABT8UAR7_9FLAO|nr:hypothetical protein [Chryseobacterium sp. APV1]MDO3427165.1 hypothetical protein [Chryseobacterium sp. APV1]